MGGPGIAAITTLSSITSSLIIDLEMAWLANVTPSYLLRVICVGSLECDWITYGLIGESISLYLAFRKIQRKISDNQT